MNELLNSLIQDYNDDHDLPTDTYVDPIDLRDYACTLLEDSVGLLRDNADETNYEYYINLIQVIQHLGNTIK